MARQYYKSIFAFLDLLGVKEYIKKDNGEFLKKLGNIYDSTLRIYKPLCQTQHKPNIQAKIFSDNIVFECKVENGDGFQEFMEVAFITAVFQEELFRNNLLLRGSITIGDSFLDDVFVFGKALSEAYLLESKIALYPRVIISKELKNIVLPNITNTSAAAYMCVEDRDGEHYVDYLSSSGKSNNSRIPIILEAIEYNNNELKREDYDSKTKQKLLWHNDYMQRKLNQFQNK